VAHICHLIYDLVYITYTNLKDIINILRVRKSKSKMLDLRKC